MKIKICISSTLDRYQKIKDILIPSLLKSGVSGEDIYFFLGACDENKHELDLNYNVNLISLTYNSIDFNAFIGIVEFDIKSDYWFYLHDTCYVTDYFYNRILNFSNITDYDIVTATNNGTCMNYGLYRNSFLHEIKQSLLNYRNYDFSFESMQYQKTKAVHHENGICDPKKLIYFTETFGQPNFVSRVGELKFGSFSCKQVIINYNNLGPRDYFNSGIERMLFFFEDVGIFKKSANYIDGKYVKNWNLNL